MSVDGMLSFRIVRMAQNLERAGRVAVGGGGVRSRRHLQTECS